MDEYKVGIWYIGDKFITALQKHAPDIRSDITGKVDSDFSHFETWDRCEKFYPLADFATYPRGRIVYDLNAIFTLFTPINVFLTIKLRN